MGYGLNLHHLEVFHAVAISGSLTAAAHSLGTSQPAITKQLRLLEETLGTVLLDRLPRGVRLTAAGELLERHARALFAQRDRALAELAELKGLRRGRLELAASLTVGSYLLPGILARFHGLYPDVAVRVSVGNTRVGLERVRDGEVDAALVEGPVELDGVEAREFARDELVVTAPAGHPLSRRRGPVPLRRILSEPLVEREEGSGTREILERELSRLGADWKPSLVVGGTEAIKGLVAAGMGLAVLSRLAVVAECRDGRLSVLRVPELSLGRALSVAQPAGRTPSLALGEFLPLLSIPFSDSGKVTIRDRESW